MAIIWLCLITSLLSPPSHAQTPSDTAPLADQISALRLSDLSASDKKARRTELLQQASKPLAYPVQREDIRLRIELAKEGIDDADAVLLMQELEYLARAHGDLNTAALMGITHTFYTHEDANIDVSINAIHSIMMQLPESPSTEVLEAMESSLGNMYYDVGNLQLAVEHQLKALALAKQLPHRSLERQLYRINTLAQVYLAMNSPEDALSYLEQGKTLADKRMPEPIRMAHQTTRAEALMHMGRFEDAKALLLDVRQKTGARLNLTKLLSELNLADALLLMNESPQAHEGLETFKPLVESIDSPYFSARFNEVWGTCHVLDGKVVEGLNFINQSIAYFTKTNQPIDLTRALNRKTRLLRDLERYKEAMAVVEVREALTQRVNQREQIRALKELKLAQAIQDREQKVVQLQTQNALQNTELKQERMEKRFSTVFAASAVLIAALLWLLFKRTSKQRDALRFDQLTGAYTRHQIQERRKKTGRIGNHLAVAIFDIDHFKRINDEFGHKSGDFVLQEFVVRLRAQLRDGDEIYRWGGEEFLLLLHVDDDTSLQQSIKRLMNVVVNKPFTLPEQGNELNITASVGVVMYAPSPEQQCALGTAIEWADAALYLAKTEGRNRAMYTGLAAAGLADDTCRSPKHMKQLVAWEAEGLAWIKSHQSGSDFETWPADVDQTNTSPS